MIPGRMSESSKSFLRDLGLLIHVPAFLCIPVLIVIFYFKELYALPAFLSMAIASLILGQVLYRIFKYNSESKPRFTLIMVALAWVVIPLFGSIPFYGLGLLEESVVGEAVLFTNFPAALFESMSGFTSTGLSMLTEPESIPRSLQWWRSLSQWLGGIGVIILAVGIFDFSSEKTMLYEAEAMNWTIEEGELERTLNKIWVIYIGLSLLSILLFYLFGMPLWEAFNHGLTAISTGGFTITNSSFIYYNDAIKWVAIAIMTIGALSFQALYLFFFKMDLKKIFQLSEFKLFMLILLGFFVVVNVLNPTGEIVDNVFQTSSALGTCGFNAVETPQMPMSILFLFMLAMSLGGNASSTTGGLKTRRVIWILKGFFKNVRETGKEGEQEEEENEEAYVYYNEKKINERKAKEQIRKASNIFVLWVISICLGTFLLIVAEGDIYDFHQILFDVTSALNNVGLTAGFAGSTMHDFSKWVFIMLMWLGRLEIFACMVLIYSIISLRIFR